MAASMARRTFFAIIPASVLLLCALLSSPGCGDGDEPSGPDDSDEPGTVVIDAEPEALSAPWDISGPAGLSGSGTGDSTMTGMTPGSYTVTWGAMSGWTAPSPETRSLTSGGTLTFSGLYTEEGYTPAEFVLIQWGSYTMGSPYGEPGSYTDEHPQHEVHLSNDFYIQSTEVTNRQFMEMMQWAVDQGLAVATGGVVWDELDGSDEALYYLDEPTSEIQWDGSTFSLRGAAGHDVHPDHPVYHVTWYGAVSYCDWLSIKNGWNRAYDHDTWACNDNNPYTAPGFRLPTEAEWEYTCRAGSETAFANGEITVLNCGLDPVLDVIGWYCGNDEAWSSAVAQKIPNSWDLYDMHGNLREWCNDWYRDDYYAGCGASITDPVGPVIGYTQRVLRGGTWLYGSEMCRSADRDCLNPGNHAKTIGFRPVRTVPELQMR
jgi:formylglycine-generating enzyme required for sulfatase activity